MNTNISQDNPYSAPMAALADVSDDELQLAGRGTRLAATLLDGVILGVGVVIGLLPSILAQDNADARDWTAALLLVIGVGFALLNLILLARNGQTIAKYMLNIRVTRPDGSVPGLARLFFARYLPVGVLGALPFIGILVSLSDALLIFRDDRRCLHDHIADTLVVRV